MSLTDLAAGNYALPSVPSATGATDAYNTASSVQDFINGVSSKYVLNPYGMKGIAGFVFDYEGEDRLSLESEISDHYAEDNSSIQDHIALRPYKVTLRGFVSELLLPGVGTGIFGQLTQLQQKLGTTGAYLGKYTPQGLQKLQGQASKAVNQIQNYANEASQYLNQAKNIAQLLGG